MKYLIMVLFMTSFVLGACNLTQIDINSASLNKLDELTGIGEVKAQAIVDARYFDSVDDLIDVYGIGEVTLAKIKDQGLACVSDSEEEIVEKIVGDIEEPKEVILKNETITIELQEKNEVLIYESKESIILRYLPYILCVVLLVIVSFLLWQRF